MNREKDIFWGLLAAATPAVFMYAVPVWEKSLEQAYYRGANLLLYIGGRFLLWAALGVLLLLLARYFWGKSADLGKVSEIGFILGWIIILLGLGIIVSVPLGILSCMDLFAGIDFNKTFLLGGFYTALLVGHWRQRRHFGRGKRGERENDEE